MRTYFHPSGVTISLIFSSRTLLRSKMPKGLSAEIFTFCRSRLDTGASGRPQIRPARPPLATVAVMFAEGQIAVNRGAVSHWLESRIRRRDLGGEVGEVSELGFR